MSESAIKKELKRLRDKTGKMLDDESFHVGRLVGKAAFAFDYICSDQMGLKAVKVCLDFIAPGELERVLLWRGSSHPATILQIIFWHKGEHRPFYRAKLFYNQPKQVIPDELQKLVK